MAKLKKGIKKTLKSDSTALINSLLNPPVTVCSEKLTEDEKIAGGLFQIIDGPLKMFYGTGMMLAGTILTPVPGIITKIKTREITDKNGTRGEIIGVSLGFRKPKTPFHYQRRAISNTILNGQYTNPYCRQVTITEGYAFHLSLTFGDLHKHEILPPQELDHYQVTTAKTTVTGYGLFTSGLGRVAAGLCDPITGLVRTGLALRHR